MFMTNAARQESSPRELWALSIFLLLTATASLGEISTDGSMGAIQDLSGPDYQIPANLGTRAGANLFHSFNTFNIHSGEIATFTGPDTINNVISRVTGGNPSTIDGMLRSEIADADFYFLNPHGVFFGPNAQVDVPAGFHVGAASELIFPDGNRFSALDTTPASLSLESPEAFGFRDAPLEPIYIIGSELLFQGSSPTTFTAGEIGVGDAAIFSASGELRLLAVDRNDLPIPLHGRTPESFTAGEVVLLDSVIEIASDGEGSLAVRADTATIEGSLITIANIGDQSPHEAVDLVVGNLTVHSDSLVNSYTLGVGPANDIRILSNHLIIDEDSGIFSFTPPGSAGNSGSVSVTANESLTLKNGGLIGSITSSSQGVGGQVFVQAGKMIIDGSDAGSTGIKSVTESTNANGGSIFVVVNENLEIFGNGEIASYTLSDGFAGNIEVQAGQMIIDGQGFDGFTGIWSDVNAGSKGDAGDVTVNVDGVLEIVDGGEISSTTYGVGDTGTVAIESDVLQLKGGDMPALIFTEAKAESSGSANDVTVKVATLLNLLPDSQIYSSTSASGDGGTVSIKAQTLRIDEDNDIRIDDDDSIRIDEDYWLVLHEQGYFFLYREDSKTQISSHTNIGSTGSAGNVLIEVDGLVELLSGGSISSNTKGLGDAGNVMVNAGNLLIDPKLGGNSGIDVWASPGSTGAAGDVHVAIDGMLSIYGGGQISSNTYSEGGAGNVMIESNALVIDGEDIEGGISSVATHLSEGDAGSVTVVVDGPIEVLNAGVISSDTFSSGDAGSVDVQADTLTINGMDSLKFTGIGSQANPGSSGNGGEVNVNVDGQVEVLSGGFISASTFGIGTGGSTTVHAGSLKLDGMGHPHRTAITSGTFSYSLDNSSIMIDDVGDAGNVIVTVDGSLEIVGLGYITSDSYGNGNAGNVTVKADSAQIGQLDQTGQPEASMQGAISSSAFKGEYPNPSGDAGNVTVDIDGVLKLLGAGYISTSTETLGKAGAVNVESGELRIIGNDKEIWAFIESASLASESGHAGSIHIISHGPFVIRNGGISSDTISENDAGGIFIDVTEGLKISNGVITSSTHGGGNAGSLAIHAGSIQIENSNMDSVGKIVTSTSPEAQGNAGSIEIFTEGSLTVNKGSVASSAFGTGQAGAITISSNGGLTLWFGSIETIADQNGHGGPISILSASPVILRDGMITTSANGTGNGGDIEISSDALIMDTGFIQANSSGGDFGGDIHVGTITLLVPADQQFIPGSVIRQTFEPGSGVNVIQAAAPGGESGNLELPELDLDLGGSLSAIKGGFQPLEPPARDPCRVAQGDIPSALVRTGQGSLPRDRADGGHGVNAPLGAIPAAADDVESNETKPPAGAALDRPQPQIGGCRLLPAFVSTGGQG